MWDEERAWGKKAPPPQSCGGDLALPSWNCQPAPLQHLDTVTVLSGSHVRRWSRARLLGLPAFNGQLKRESVKEIEGEWPKMGADVGSQDHVISGSLSVMDDLSGL